MRYKLSFGGDMIYYTYKQNMLYPLVRYFFMTSECIYGLVLTHWSYVFLVLIHWYLLDRNMFGITLLFIIFHRSSTCSFQGCAVLLITGLYLLSCYWPAHPYVLAMQNLFFSQPYCNLYVSIYIITWLMRCLVGMTYGSGFNSIMVKSAN